MRPLLTMQGRRTFLRIDLWLQGYVTSGYVRVALMVVALLAAHVLAVVLVSGLVDLIVWLLAAPAAL